MTEKKLTKDHLNYLLGRGLSKETIERFGLHSNGISIAIPVNGYTRLYTPGGSPKIRWQEPLDGETAPPFPSWSDLSEAELIVEGEFDCMLAIQNGFKAVTGTAGARTFLQEWADGITKDVTILYDHDDPGRLGSLKAAQIISERGHKVSLARWPQDKTKGYDVSDFFMQGGTADELRDIVSLGVPFEPVVVGLSSFGDLEADLDGTKPIPTGYKQIDEIVYGLRKGEITVIAARPKVGKSTLAMNIMANVAKRGGRVAMFSLEMSEQQLLERLIAAECRVPKRNLERGLADSDVIALYEHLPKVWRLPMLIDTQAKLGVKKIRERTLKAADENPIELVAVDYVQIIDTTEKTESRARQLAAAMEDLKNLSKEIGASVLVLSQINREGARDEGEEPQLHQLLESGGIEATADCVTIMWRKRKEEKEAVERGLDIPTHGRVAKNRNGPEGYFKLILDGPKCLFYEEEV